MSRRVHLDLIGLNLALLLAASAVCSLAWGVATNRLELHDAWESTKTGVARAVPAANAYVTFPQSVARDGLDLSSWFGFQEVLLGRSIELSQWSLTARAEPDGYVNVLYDVRDDGFSGIRLSTRTDLPSIQFHAAPDGEFTAQTPLTASFAPNMGHAVEIRFEGSQADVTLDGHPLGTFPRVAGAQRVGFRGGQRHAWVDDIILRLADGSVVRERFANTAHAASRALGLFGFGTVALLIGGVLLTRVSGMSWRIAGFWGVLVNVCLVLAAGGYYAYAFFAPKPYPAAVGQILHVEFTQATAARQALRDALMQRYGHPEVGNPYRILFLGSSQTWGAGAWEPEDVWVTRLEQLLNADGRHRKIECINAGVSALVASQVADFVPDLLALHPDAAVIDLGNGDVDTAAFHTSLETIVTTLAHAGVETVLLREANSPERRPADGPQGDLAVKHRIMDQIGAAHQVPVIDLHGYLAEKNSTGFLWWDFDHMTSYGQRLTADKLHADLSRLLRLP